LRNAAISLALWIEWRGCRVDRSNALSRGGKLIRRAVAYKEIALMSWIGAIVIGLLAGIVAKLLMPGRDPGGFIITTLLGMAGALIATWLGQVVGWYGPGEVAGFIGAVVGAIIVLALYRLVARRTA
jgi:uncharacterized membrane protein YeaQ/YmgE (transglycosylase-associated protein family)